MESTLRANLSRDYQYGMKEALYLRSSPGKSGRPVRSSAMMQPTDQMST